MNSQTLFNNYIIAGVEVSLARVRAAEYVVPEADRQQAWQILSFALKVDEAWPVTRELLLELAPKMEMAGFREEWIPYLEKGIQCAQNADDRLAIAECKLQIGLLYRLVNRLDDAYRWTSQSVQSFFLQNDTHGQARALNEVAWIQHLKLQYDEAAQNVEQALALFEEDNLERAMSYRVQGMIAAGRRKFQQSENYHRKSLTHFKAQNNLRGIAWAYQNIAYALREQRKLQVAVELYQKSQQILKEISDRYHYAFVTLNLGTTYLYMNDPVSAMTFYTEAETIFTQLHNQLYLAHIQNNIGLCYLKLEKFTQARIQFTRASNLFDELGDMGWSLNAMDGLAMTYMAMQEWETAATLLKKAIAKLPEIVGSRNYNYLQRSLAKHLQEANQKSAVTS